MERTDMSFSPEWLALREPADAAARAADLLDPVRERLAGVERPVIRDLGCGTGSMARWLAPLLDGPQHWVLYDQDPALLDRATESIATASLPAPVTASAVQADVTALTAADLAGADLITTSALLDLLTADEVDRLAAACVEAGCPALLTLSVTGRVDLDPVEDLDADLAAAFNAHQRRSTGGRRLLGPDAVEATAGAFGKLSVPVRVSPSPWRLGSAAGALTAEWLRGWVGAACEQEPALVGPSNGYLERRLDAIAAGELGVLVHHSDLLADPE
jgi:SAM-dependent methyltransferase